MAGSAIGRFLPLVAALAWASPLRAQTLDEGSEPKPVTPSRRFSIAAQGSGNLLTLSDIPVRTGAVDVGVGGYSPRGAHYGMLNLFWGSTEAGLPVSGVGARYRFEARAAFVRFGFSVGFGSLSIERAGSGSSLNTGLFLAELFLGPEVELSSSQALSIVLELDTHFIGDDATWFWGPGFGVLYRYDFLRPRKAL